MNPFSAFLQPVSRPLEAPNVFGQLGALAQQRKELQERTREADQHNAYNQGMLKLQQDQQAHSFAEQDRKDVEGLISEYQDAVSRGDAQGIQDSIQKMKRFGLDVAPEKEKLPPGAGRDEKGNLTTVSPFTGLPFAPQNPYDLQQGAVSDDGTPPLVRANDPNDDHILSQKEFEDRLIGDSMTDSGIENSRTDGGFQLPGDTADPGDAGRNGKVMDLDAESPAKAAGPEPAQQNQVLPGLPGGLPIIVSRGGKELYRSGSQGRWAPLVQSVFGPLAEQQDPKAAEAGKRAQAIAQKLIAVDGISPKDAIEFARDVYEKEMARGSAELRTRLGSQARGGSFMKERAPYANLIHQTITEFKDQNLEEGIRGYDGAAHSLNSGSPASQYDALRQLVMARSGKTVTDREKADYDQMDGLLGALEKTWDRASGQPLPEDFRQKFNALLADARQSLLDAREERARTAEQTHAAKLRGAPESTVKADSKAVGDAIRMGGGAAPTDDSVEGLY